MPPPPASAPRKTNNGIAQWNPSSQGLVRMNAHEKQGKLIGHSELEFTLLPLAGTSPPPFLLFNKHHDCIHQS